MSFQGSRRDQEEGGGAGPQPRRDHEQEGGAGLRKLDFFRFGLFLNSSATDTVQARQMKQQLRGALVAAQWRGDTALTAPLFSVAALHGLFGLFRAVSAVEPSLSRNLASVDLKQNGPTLSHPEECIFLCQYTIAQIYRVTPRVLGWGNATRTAEQQT